uniref:Major capsid protein n=1 Tax=Dulem virus 267 TaxID=3145744 RepID=A0AAU8AWB7_9VIRU
MTMKVPNIKLGFSKSKYSHNLSRDCNTTFAFGVVQPIFSQYMLPNSDIKVDSKQLVRLAPMPVPSFARVSLRSVTRFVPEIDVVPYADAFYSKMPYRGQVPSQLPSITNPVLVYYLLAHSNFELYSINSDILSPVDVIPVSIKQAFSRLFYQNTHNGQFPFGDNYHISSANASPLRPLPTPENADYVVFFNGSSPTNPPDFCACFNFGFKAKNFRNICLGLGYSLDMDDFNAVRFSPLLSFYKAYYDTYGITRFKSFTETKCFDIIINYIDTLSYVDFSNPQSPNVPYDSKLFDFFDELSNCYFATSQDIVSLHRQKLADGSPASNLDFYTDSSTADTISSPKNDIPSFDVNNTSGIISNITIQTLTRLARFVNKNSVLGKRLSEYMRLHYGSDKVASVFQDSNFVNSSVLDCQINDVFSTSDTAQYDVSTNTKTGESLGAFAGKGLGFGDLRFNFSAPCHGYLVTLASIVPDSGYFQGNSPDLFAITWEQQPCADFDALGYEATPRAAFINHNDISHRWKLKITDLDHSFGFVPKFTGFKFAKNVVNGDMSRRGSIDSLSPYYLDHIITSSLVTSSPVGDGTFKFNLSSAVVPSTSYDWRYVTKYPWLGNFLRLFINDVGPLDKGSAVAFNGVDYDKICLDDSFICQCAFKVTMSNCLKPLSLSFDTYEQDTDNASRDVNPS